MAYAEVSFSTGNSPKFTDGMPIDVKGRGVLISPAELVAWFQSATIPASVQALEPNRKAEIKRAVLQVKYLSTPGRTAVEAATLRWGKATAELEAEAQAAIDRAVLDKVDYLAHGYDTNWSPKQLETVGVLPVDLSPAAIRDLIRKQMDPSRHSIKTRLRLRIRRWRVPYEVLAPAAMVAKLRDPEVRVDVQRQITPFTAAQIKEALLR